MSKEVNNQKVNLAYKSIFTTGKYCVKRPAKLWFITLHSEEPNPLVNTEQGVMDAGNRCIKIDWEMIHLTCNPKLCLLGNSYSPFLFSLHTFLLSKMCARVILIMGNSTLNVWKMVLKGIDLYQGLFESPQKIPKQRFKILVSLIIANKDLFIENCSRYVIVSTGSLFTTILYTNSSILRWVTRSLAFQENIQTNSSLVMGPEPHFLQSTNTVQKAFLSVCVPHDKDDQWGIWIIIIMGQNMFY